MNIMIFTPYFWPENFRINDFAEEFIRNGHDVTVLTPIPNYPEGEYYAGYGLFKRRKEMHRGIKIVRVFVIPRGNGNKLRLFLSYLSFAICSLYHIIVLSQSKFDLIFVHEPSPITVGIPAIMLKKLKRVPLFFWVLDLWPESVRAAGNLTSDLIPNLLVPLVKFIYKHSDKILVSSRGFIPSVAEKSVPQEKIAYYPQWAEEIFRPLSKPTNRSKYSLPSGFLIMFAGNIGEAQDFGSIIRAAEIVKNNDDIHWIIVGGGRKEAWVRDEVERRGLESTFHLPGRYPLKVMPEFYSMANAMLISLKKADIFSLTVPGKLQTYMACGKPILAMMDGEGARIIVEAGAGLTCEAETPEALAKNVLKMYNMDSTTLKKMGKNAYSYYKENFDRSLLLNRFEDLFESAVIQA